MSIRKARAADKKRVWRSLLIAGIVAAMLSISLYYMFQIKPYCSYNRFVHNVGKDDYIPIEATEDYRYEIDYFDYIRNDAGNISDYFGLIQISGWEVVRQGDVWGNNMRGILLGSEACSYSVDVIMKKKTDIPYLDQSDPDDKSLNVAFFTYIPQDSLLTGSYRIGILVQESRQSKVLWTDYRLEVY